MDNTRFPLCQGVDNKTGILLPQWWQAESKFTTLKSLLGHQGDMTEPLRNVRFAPR